MDFDLKEMSPYTDKDVSSVLPKILNDPLFAMISKYLWPETPLDVQIAKSKHIDTVLGFQKEFMHSAIRTITDRSSDGLTYTGTENLDPDESYLFIANHRDILLDSAILQTILVENGFDTTEITFGNNLMKEGFITQLGKLNRMFTVEREGTARELYQISQRLSAYIRNSLEKKKASVWIAQRAGRTKDGDDLTQTGLLKMLNISGTGTFEEKMAQLKIVPLSISYEYEPCVDLKVQETYLSSLHAKYIKAPDEDLMSIASGVMENKGKIHLAFGKQILMEDLIFETTKENEKIKLLAKQIDRQIYNNYQLCPVHYIAYDTLMGKETYKNEYSEAQKNDFMTYAEEKITTLEGDKDSLKSIFYALYANPLINQLKIKNGLF
ncbi:1-acyl-sn-glycerol-3-phosphate acyltransferase [Arcticibacterium luteifluviistationis]|uniref:Glycerol acyltransferase n=1 Tax=Arcticibacterium luteifluviistationis TaxID=1784714 RepID=A0A2Z4GDV5_9BACT|nr:1-acyl-sn-glycerol-3-phosphate acyltransferase [Arcticibacterium luteifluviistationis]AWV99178.1 glycerol acyltransferase [Arcticibacterium luteifluviistationis]